MKVKDLFSYIRSLPKTLYFNFHYFPFVQAAKLPVIIASNVKLNECGGRIILPNAIHTGMIRIGFGMVNAFDAKYERCIWSLRDGEVTFGGKASLGQGSRISVVEGGELQLGDNFRISANSSILCSDKISFGDNCLLSWDVLVMDSDTHKVFDTKGNITNISKEVKVGNHVWIGCRNTILKGAEIPDDCVIAAGSLITKKFEQTHCILGGVRQLAS